MIVLGLDLSQRSTGWAVIDRTARPAFGQLDYPSWGNDEPVWLSEFHQWLALTIQMHNVTHVYYEQTFIPTWKRGTKVEAFATRYAQLALVAVTQMTAYESGADVYVANISDWRNRFIGTNRSPPSYKGDHSTRWFKRRAIMAANLLGWFTSSDNEAEALGVAHYGMCCIDRRYTEQTAAHTARMQRTFAEEMRGER